MMAPMEARTQADLSLTTPPAGADPAVWHYWHWRRAYDQHEYAELRHDNEESDRLIGVAGDEINALFDAPLTGPEAALAKVQAALTTFPGVIDDWPEKRTFQVLQQLADWLPTLAFTRQTGEATR